MNSYFKTQTFVTPPTLHKLECLKRRMNEGFSLQRLQWGSETKKFVIKRVDKS